VQAPVRRPVLPTAGAACGRFRDDHRDRNTHREDCSEDLSAELACLYRDAAQRIERYGGSNLHVKLDFEIKSDVQKDIYRARKADAQHDVAHIASAPGRKIVHVDMDAFYASVYEGDIGNIWLDHTDLLKRRHNHQLKIEFAKEIKAELRRLFRTSPERLINDDKPKSARPLFKLLQAELIDEAGR